MAEPTLVIAGTGGNWTVRRDFGSATGTDGEVRLQAATIVTAGGVEGRV